MLTSCDVARRRNAIKRKSLSLGRRKPYQQGGLLPGTPWAPLRTCQAEGSFKKKPKFSELLYCNRAFCIPWLGSVYVTLFLKNQTSHESFIFFHLHLLYASALLFFMLKGHSQLSFQINKISLHELEQSTVHTHST